MSKEKTQLELIEDVIPLILSHLNVSDLVNASLVNSTWNHHANNDDLWKIQFESTFPWVTESNNKVFGSWKRAYIEKFKLEQNPNFDWCHPMERKNFFLTKITKNKIERAKKRNNVSTRINEFVNNILLNLKRSKSV